jgi:sulfide:quinone oxidoreductase
VHAIVGAHVEKVEPGVIHYETLDGSHYTQQFDFSMLIPPFGGVDMKAYDRDGSDITSEIFAPSGFMKVDANYTAKPFEEWKAADWPETYEVPGHPNMFRRRHRVRPAAPDLATPGRQPNGTMIAPAPPRHRHALGRDREDLRADGGGPDQERSRRPRPQGLPGQARRGCVASAGAGLRTGSAATMTVYPVVPDWDRPPHRPEPPRHPRRAGLAGHWVKLMLHYLFIYKAKALPGWPLIPE